MKILFVLQVFFGWNGSTMTNATFKPISYDTFEQCEEHAAILQQEADRRYYTGGARFYYVCRPSGIRIDQ